MPVAGTDLTVGQTSHRLISEALGDELRQAVQAGPSVADQADSIRYRVSAVLYLLLREHSIDRRGRCRSCRRPGAMMTIRRQPCRILIKARYWLLRPPEEAQLLSLLAAELPASPPSSPSASQAHRPIHSGPDKQGRDSASATPTCCPPSRPVHQPSRRRPRPSRLCFLPTVVRGRDGRDSLQNQTGAHPDRRPACPGLSSRPSLTVTDRRVAGDPRRHAVAKLNARRPHQRRAHSPLPSGQS
jgi:hypothetical protein